ncbi:hypothetical protein BGW38_007759, partial [Lunasporangiospora selenospora]
RATSSEPTTVSLTTRRACLSTAQYSIAVVEGMSVYVFSVMLAVLHMLWLKTHSVEESHLLPFPDQQQQQQPSQQYPRDRSETATRRPRPSLATVHRHSSSSRLWRRALVRTLSSSTNSSSSTPSTAASSSAKIKNKAVTFNQRVMVLERKPTAELFASLASRHQTGASVEPHNSSSPPSTSIFSFGSQSRHPESSQAVVEARPGTNVSTVVSTPVTGHGPKLRISYRDIADGDEQDNEAATTAQGPMSERQSTLSATTWPPVAFDRAEQEPRTLIAVTPSAARPSPTRGGGGGREQPNS